MISSVLSFLLGVICVQRLSILPDRYEMASLAMLLAFFIRRRCWRLMSLVIGMFWTSFFAMALMAEILPQEYEGKDMEIRGYVDSLPMQKQHRTSFDFIVQRPERDFPEKIRLNWYFPEQSIKAGQYWRLTVRLKKPRGRYNPGAFDYELWLFSRHIGAVGYVRNKPVPVLLTEHFCKPGFSAWRQGIADRLNDLLSGSRHPAIIKALTIGDRSSMTAAAWEMFRKTGTVHLVAISGLHVGLAAGLVYFLVLHAWAYAGVLTFSPQKAAVIGALLTASCYAALAGFALPTQRALAMLSMALTAIYWQRQVTSMHILMSALMFVVVIDPLAVMSASFCLSFAAVTLIIYTLSARLGQLGYWRSLVKIHLVTAMGLAPLIMYYFQQISLIAPIANLVAVPVISLLVVPMSLLAMLLLTLVPVFAEWLLLVVDWVLHGLWLFLSACAELPLAALATAQPPFYALVLALIGVLLILAPPGIPGRYLGLALLLPLVFVDVERPVNGEARLTLLDVGQGLAAVVETQHHVLVFDAGAKFSEDFDMGAAVVVPYLRHRGIKHVDTLLISHGDNDHIGGAESILATIPVQRIISGVQEMASNHHAEDCRSGEQWDWDGVRFRLLSPLQRDHFQTENDNSCVLKITMTRQAFLLTGDIEQTAEHWLLKHFGDILRSEVLIAPHHGSDTSSSLAFLQRVDPNIALIPAGYRNRFSFPHRQVLDRYELLDIGWLTIAEEGAIVVTTDAEMLLVESSRETGKRYWFPQ